jgi:hypothetical protein
MGGRKIMILKKIHIPKIFTHPLVLKHIFQEAAAHPGGETGWGHYGIHFPNGNIIVTHTLLPTKSDVVREVAHVKVGGDEMGEAGRWLMHNDYVAKKQKKYASRGTFSFCGKGHSHHKLRYAKHSGTDTQTTIDMVKVDGFDVAVSTLVLIDEHEDMTFKHSGKGLVSIKDTMRMTVMFYYYSKAMVEAGIDTPMLVTPKILQMHEVPMIPPLGWRFASEGEYYEQMRHLKHYGATVHVRYQDVDNGPPMEILLTIQKPNWKSVLQIVTPWDYPKSAPKFVTFPSQDKVATEVLDYAEADHLLEGDIWNPGEDLIEAIFRLEARGKL